MDNDKTVGSTDLPASRRGWPVLFYGIYATLVGATNFLQGGLMLYSGREASESNFVGHLTEAHAATLFGLGCVALGAYRLRSGVRPMYAAFFLANLVGAFVCLLSTPTSERGLDTAIMTISQLVWSIAFYWLSRAPSGASPSQAPSHAQDLFGQLLLISFCLLVTASGLIWVLAPLKFAAAAAGSLAGTAATFAGQSRGVADVAIGLIAWAASSSQYSSLRRPVVISLFVANALLAAAGLLAQFSIIYTPTRWLVEALHVLWAAGFAWMWVRMRSRDAKLSHQRELGGLRTRSGQT